MITDNAERIKAKLALANKAVSKLDSADGTGAGEVDLKAVIRLRRKECEEVKK